ncbi:MAG TPA: pyridoxal 5'-phosphate synthase lyase subunit PdxS [Alphaproteobacteria bacterium]|nr:pyridoxal 5'-phosphate synthase lyase subunit PdxS [Alphaproteobacteria bacterium]
MSKSSSFSNVINIKTGLAEMLKGGVIMDVVTPEQARVAEDAGAIAVMALERVPSDIRKAGGVARMSPPELIEAIKKEVSIPVMAKCRIGHFAEAQILEAIGVDYIDESEVLTPADDQYHVNKQDFKIPFVCGAKNLGEALRRIGEGAALIRSKGEPGTGNIVEAVRHMRAINAKIRTVESADESELVNRVTAADELLPAAETMARDMAAPYELLKVVKELGRLPVPLFSAGGIATPADAALCMQLGAESVFVGSGIFKSDNPEKFARAIVKATAHYADPKIVLEASKELEGVAMRGTEISEIDEPMKMANRGW